MLFVGGLQLAYTLRSHKKYRSVGHLWQDRFKNFGVERTAYLLECGRYIERTLSVAALGEAICRQAREQRRPRPRKTEITW